MCVKVLFSYTLLYGPCTMCVLFVKLFFLCYLHNILKKYLSVVSLFCFCFVVAAVLCMFCIFMTYFTSYCCHYELRDPWNECTYV
jgi:hypothetical protein